MTYTGPAELTSLTAFVRGAAQQAQRSAAAEDWLTVDLAAQVSLFAFPF